MNGNRNIYAYQGASEGVSQLGTMYDGLFAGDNDSAYTSAPALTVDLTGGPFANSVSALGGWFQDGTSDGTHNYLVNYVSASVYQTDLDWSNAQYLFTLRAGDAISGITYDRTDNSLWLYSSRTGLASHTSFTGSLLDEVDLGASGGTNDLSALAMDADHTLWLVYNSGNVGDPDAGKLYHFSALGALLGIETPTNRAVAAMGGEIASVPEPTNLALMALGGVALLARRRQARRG